jgi:hypothetical protein
MKTTLNLDARLWARLKAAAATQGRTMSELVELAIRRLLQERRGTVRELPPLPTFDGGGASVDLANRDELYRVLEGR